MKYLVIMRGGGADLWFETDDEDRAWEWAEAHNTDEVYETTD